MAKFIKSYKVRGTELDENYRMRQIFAACYFQECFAEMCASFTLAGYDMQRIGLTWIITDFRIDFTSAAMPFWRDEVQVGVWASEKNPLFLVMDFSISSGGKQIAQGSSKWLLVEDATHKPARLSPHGDKFEVFPEKIFTREVFAKFFEEECDISGSVERIIPSSEVDFNGHMTNVMYAPTSLESIPFAFRSGRRLKSYRIKFMREALLGDKIVSESFECPNGRYFTKITRTADRAVLSNMESFWE